MKFFFLFAGLLASSLCRWSAAQTTAPSTQPTLIRLKLHPQATSQLALQYELLPPMADTKPGDAAYKYQLADVSLSRNDYDPSGEKEDRLLNAPRDAFPIADAAAFLEQRGSHWIADAARCERAHWDTDFRDQGICALLPYLNCVRAEANVVAVEGRLSIAKGDFKAAQQSIQTNLAMARQLNDDPCTVQALVEAGIIKLAMDKNVIDWVARDHSPNLYWALTDLPGPFIDLAAVERMERAQLAFTDQPYLAQALEGTLPAEQWPQIIRFMVRVQYVIKTGVWNFKLDKKAETEVDQQYKTLVDAETPVSRKYLISTGTPAAEVAAMSDTKAIGVCWIQQYKLAADDQWKGWTLPCPQAAEMIQSAQTSLEASHQSEHNLLLQQFVFSKLKARCALAMPDREIALLRIIEALRDYTARHGGAVPDSLEQVTDLPIPLDPITGKRFSYRKDKNTLFIDVKAPPGSSVMNELHYELTFTAP